jgi:hypothetical protein
MSLSRATPAEQRQAKLQRQHQENLRRLAKSNEQKQSLKQRNDGGSRWLTKSESGQR